MKNVKKKRLKKSYNESKQKVWKEMKKEDWKGHEGERKKRK